MDLSTLNLGDRTITAALTDVTLTEGVSAAGNAQAFVDRLPGLTSLTLVAAFTYGSGGTTARVDIETAFANGVWYPIARFDFTTASATKFLTVSGLTPRLSALTSAALSADTAIDGVIGDRLRAKLTTTGTYAGSTQLAIRAQPR